MAKMAGLRFGS